MACEVGISFQNAVCSGIVASCVHGIRASLVEGGGKTHVACVPTNDINLRHAVRYCSLALCRCSERNGKDELKLEYTGTISRGSKRAEHIIQTGLDRGYIRARKLQALGLL